MLGKLNKKVALLLSCTLLLSMFTSLFASAQDNDIIQEYPYVLFTNSKAGSLSIETNQLTVNGDIHTNGKFVLSSNNTNVNGKISVTDEYILNCSNDIYDKLSSHNYISVIDIKEKIMNTNFRSNCSFFVRPCILSSKNINITNNFFSYDTLLATGNLYASASVGSVDNMTFSGDIFEGNNTTLYSEKGNIDLTYNTATLTGLIYAPNGKVTINCNDFQFNGVIIANEISIKGEKININYNSDIAKIVGVDKEQETKKDIEFNLNGNYIKDSNTINLSWAINYDVSNFGIFASTDNNTYKKITNVSNNNKYTYQLNNENGKIYFKILCVVDKKLVETNIICIEIPSEDEIDYTTDTDNDMLPDYYEKQYQTDINLPDTDGDGLTDYQEVVILRTSPLLKDTDGNNVLDPDEDFDSDKVNNLQELKLGLDPFNPDTDEDTLSDGDEINIYKTNPLLTDTDGDTISDSDEIKIGLSPINPKTFGIPDTEYVFNQNILPDNKNLEEINSEDNSYNLSIDIKSAGIANDNIFALESLNSNIISNEAIIGSIADINYNSDLKVDSAKIKFKLNDDLIDNTGSEYSQISLEFGGIKRFNIFKYFDDDKMLLPVETKFDIDNNTIYCDVDELGTYCVIDMEKWLKGLDIAPEDTEEEPAIQNRPLPVTISHSAADDFSMLCGPESIVKNPSADNNAQLDSYDILLQKVQLIMSNYDNNLTTDNNVELDSHDLLLQKSHSNSPANTVRALSADTETIEKTADVVFILQSTTDSRYKNYYDKDKEYILFASQQIFAYIPDARIAIIEFNATDSNYITLESGEKWATNYEQVNNMLDKSKFTDDFEYCDRVYALNTLIYKGNYRPEATKFAYLLTTGAHYSSGAWFLFSNYSNILDAHINYSEISPVGWRYIQNDSSITEEEYAKKLSENNALYLKTNDDWSSTVAYHVYTNLEEKPTLPKVRLNAIVATGLKKIALDGPLNESNGIDTDNDGLTDWQEVSTSWSGLSRDENGDLVLPTFIEACQCNKAPYVQEGLVRYRESQGDSTSKMYKMMEKLYNTPILPIKSDPTNVDGDYDFISDIDDSDPLMYNTNNIDDNLIDDSDINELKQAKSTMIDGNLSYVNKDNLYIPQITYDRYKTFDNHTDLFSIKPTHNSDYMFELDSRYSDLTQEIEVYSTDRRGNAKKIIDPLEVQEISSDFNTNRYYRFSLSEDKRYIVRVISAEDAKPYKFTIRQDNWVYAPDGGIAFDYGSLNDDSFVISATKSKKSHRNNIGYLSNIEVYISDKIYNDYEEADAQAQGEDWFIDTLVEIGVPIGTAKLVAKLAIKKGLITKAEATAFFWAIAAREAIEIADGEMSEAQFANCIKNGNRNISVTFDMSGQNNELDIPKRTWSKWENNYIYKYNKHGHKKIVYGSISQEDWKWICEL